MLRHFTENKSSLFWSGFVGFLGVAIFLRYYLGFHPAFDQSKYQLFFGILFYSTPYFFTIFWYAFTYQKNDFLLKKDFWFLSFLILLVLVANQYFYRIIIKDWIATFDMDLHIFINALIYNLNASFFYLLIPLIYGFYHQKINETSFFGCTAKGFDFKTYALMLLLMLPLLVWASARGDFGEAYPRYKPDTAEIYWQISSYWTVGIYELSYVLQFLGLEIFFRGFIVLALAKYLGSASVFPMVAVYVFLHFFKPMPETLGSAFGGYILGVVALYSRSVLGGMMVHIGIALLMEALAFGRL